MANTFTLIASSTVGAGGAASIGFTGIPTTYTDLCVKFSIRTAYSGLEGDDMYVAFNSITTGYSDRFVAGNGGTAYSGTGGTATKIYSGLAPSSIATENTFSNIEIYIPNYTGSTDKSISVDSTSENNSSAGYDVLVAGLMSNTASISSLTVTSGHSSNILQYSTAYLYGVKNA